MALKEIMGDTGRLRPHVKPHKCKQAVALMLEEGISKFKCTTIAEAEMLALSGAKDVLIALQPVGPKIKRLLNLIKSYPFTTFATIIDNKAIAKSIAIAGKERKLSVNAWLDLNTGGSPTGLPPEKALETYKATLSMKGIKITGLHAYDAYITGTNAETRKNQCLDAYKKIATVRDEIAESGFPKLPVNTGRTATINCYKDYPEAECSPGTFIYWDQNHQDLYPELPFEAAAVVVGRVISRQGDHLLCLDLGYKSVISPGSLQQPIRFLNTGKFQIIDQSEEQLLLEVMDDDNMQIGHVLYGIPYNIGSTCNLYQTASAVYNHQIKSQWINFTGRKLSI